MERMTAEERQERERWEAQRRAEMAAEAGIEAHYWRVQSEWDADDPINQLWAEWLDSE